MKNLRVKPLFALLLCVLAGFAVAQNTPQMQTVRPTAPAATQRIAPVQPAQVTTPVEQAAPEVDLDRVDPQKVIDRLRTQNRTLKQENNRLKNEVAARDARISAFTTRGGSEVRAYCEAENVSRNTAGATQSCGTFACNEVSGLCHESCTLTAHCSTGACLDGQCRTEAPSSDD